MSSKASTTTITMMRKGPREKGDEKRGVEESEAVAHKSERGDTMLLIRERRDWLNTESAFVLQVWNSVQRGSLNTGTQTERTIEGSEMK